MKKVGEVKTLHPAERGQVMENGAAIDRMSEVDRFSPEELCRRKIIYAGMDNLKILNVFRELRTQLMQINNRNNFVCMVRAIGHGGGASHLAINLAAVFALDKTKTSLLIDANIYTPSLNSLIIGDASAGITDYLSDQSLSVKDIVYATGVPRLRVVPIGCNVEAAAEYFSSEKMIRFIEELRSRYPDRYIFIDAPPVADSSEARILAEIADLVILVVPHGGATMDEVSAAIDIVGKQKLSGLVYNN
jgi:Mrp family chromosome partitioning ATPase